MWYSSETHFQPAYKGFLSPFRATIFPPHPSLIPFYSCILYLMKNKKNINVNMASKYNIIAWMTVPACSSSPAGSF